MQQPPVCSKYDQQLGVSSEDAPHECCDKQVPSIHIGEVANLSSSFIELVHSEQE